MKVGGLKDPFLHDVEASFPYPAFLYVIFLSSLNVGIRTILL